MAQGGAAMAWPQGLIDGIGRASTMDAQAIQEFLTRTAAEAGLKILTALVFWLIGRWLIGRVIAVIRVAMNRNAVDPTLTTYLASMVAGGERF